MTLPIGSIIMWKNTTVPTGWAICNGSNGTPDLRGKLVQGASDNTEVGTTNSSGSHSHTRPSSTSTDGSHQHSMSIGLSAASGTSSGIGANAFGSNAASSGHGHGSGRTADTSGADGSHSHTVASSTESTDFEPPYLKLHYIMRVS